MWSFARQYPAFLYPGQNERDPDMIAAPDPAARELLVGHDPRTWRRVAREIEEMRPDILVLPAWTFFLAPSLGWIARAARRGGSEVRMIVHNAFDHEENALKRRASLWQLAQADAFLTHGEALADTLRRHFPDRPVAVSPHPVFDDLPEPETVLPRRAPLELLFFGLVRPYKGLDIALEAFARARRNDMMLTVAGEFWEGLEETRALIARLGIGDRVELIPRFVSDAEAAALFDRADLTLLPYRSATGSGVTPTSYRYGRAVACSDLPGLASVVRPEETGWLTPPGDVEALAALLRGMTCERAAAAGRSAKSFGATLGWDAFAAKLIDRLPPCAAR